MRDTWFIDLSVAPIEVGEQNRFDAELNEHHWLGHRMVGETVRYAAGVSVFQVRAVRMVQEQIGQGGISQAEARREVGELLDINPSTLRN